MQRPVLIIAIAAVSLNLILGYGGMVSFGHAAYFAIGGYTNAILLTTYELPLIVAMPAAILLAMWPDLPTPVTTQ